MKLYVVVDEVDITQEMINRSIGNDYTKLRRNISKGGGTLWKRIFTIDTSLHGDIPNVFINYVVCNETEIKVILRSSDWQET